MKNGRYVAIGITNENDEVLERKLFDVTGDSMYEYMTFADSVLKKKNGTVFIVRVGNQTQTLEYIRMYGKNATKWVKVGSTSKINYLEKFEE